MNKNCGIYKITNKVNNKLYIGQSVNLKQRKSTHFNELRNNIHYNSYLQRSFNKYKENSFEFTIIEYCDREELYNRENYWISYYNSYNQEYGYNATIPPTDGKKYNMTSASKQKLSDSKRVFEDDELLSYLEEYYYHHGKVPTQRDIANTEGFPSNKIFYERFGSFGESLKMVGMYENLESKWLFDRVEYTKEEVFDKYSKFINAHGRFPLWHEYSNSSQYYLPSFNVVAKHYGGIENLRTILGFTKESQLEKEKVEALKNLYSLYIQDGKISSRTIDKSSLTRSASFYSSNFGSLVNAYKLAGIDNYRNRSI